MSLTYSTLQTTIADTLNRDDLSGQIGTFILLCEASVNRSLRHWRMIERLDYPISSRYTDIPSGFLEVERIEVSGTTQLDLLATSKMMEYRASSDTAGQPCYYVNTAGQIEVYPSPDAEYDGEITYYSELPALSDTTETNWLLEAAPDIYIYGALLHTAPYLQEDARLAVWKSLYDQALTDMNTASSGGLWGGSGLAIR